MSFALKPINPKIQRVLEEKSKILSRDTSALGTQGGMPNKLNEVQGRSSWIRWISGDIDPIVILGGVGINDNGVGYSLAKGFKEVYVPPDSATMKYSPSQSRSADGTLFKPLAGVKSITTSFEGATKALRKTVVTWTVFDLDELEVLTPHFLSPGKWTMLEVGWNYDGKTFKNLVGNKFFEVKDGKENAPAKPKTDKFEDLGSLDEIIYDNGGDYDVFSGIITNFEYSVRDDGGFDCTTTFTTHGISLLDAGKDTTTFTVDTAFEKIELTDDASLIGRLEQDNINIAMQKLATYFRVQTTSPKYYLKSSMLLNRVGSQDPWPDGDFYGPQTNTNWFTYTGVMGEYHNKDLDGTIPLEFQGLKAATLKNNIMTEDTPAASWVRWGWFEDNILSKYAGYASMTTNEAGEVTGINELKLKFRSIEDVLISDPDAGTLGVKKVDENNKPIKESVRILSHRNLITTDVNKFILIGKTPSLEKDTKGIYASLGKFLNNAPDGLKKYEFAVPKKDVPKKEVTEENTDETTVIPNEHEIEEGYIRNIFFNVRWLQEQFKGVGTLREVIDNIWNAFNAEYQNYWQFDVVGDINDTSIARITDINNSRYGVNKFKISDIKLKTPDPPTSYYGCYQFPTWTKDSIVSNMDYSVTIPTSQVAVAALSGGNLDANKIAQRNRGNIDVQTFVKSMHKSFEDSKERFFDNVTRIAEYSAVPSVAKFGNNLGDENASLSESGPNMINTLIKRDKDLVNAKIGETKVKAFKQGKIDDGQISLRSAHDFFKTPEAGKQTTNKTDWKVSLYNNGAIQSEGNSDYISVMLGIMHTSPTESKGALTDLLNGIAELKLTIDGTAGIFPGDAFTSMHLPNHLRPDISTGILPLLFQVTNVEQSISPDGWKTTISGQPRMNHKHVYNRTEAESGFEKLVKELKGTIVAGAVTSEALLTRLFVNRNILGINRKYLNRFEMFMGITKILDDEYFDTISTTHSAGTPLMGWRKDTSVATDDGKLEWSTTTYTHQTSHTTNYSWEERCTPAMFSGRTIEEVMRFAMYNGILYAMPDEQTHNSTRDPYTSVDKTFQCVSYNLFKGDNPDTHRWKLNGKIPGYTTEYIEQMENDLNNFTLIENEAGHIGNTGIEGLYTPMAILRRGKDIMNKFLRSKGDTTSDPNWTKTKKYQQLFTFEKKSPITVDIDWWPDKEVQTYNLRINGDSYEIWFDYFKCMFDSYLGTDWEERAQLVKPPSTKDDTWKGDEEKNKPTPNDRSDVERAHLKKLFDSENMFKYGVEKFSVENEIHKFLKHMVDPKGGFDFSPELIWWKSLDSSDNNLDWFGVASKKDSFSGEWDPNYAHGDNGNASWQIYPYEDTDEGKQKITYVWYDKNADGTRGTKHKKKVN